MPARIAAFARLRPTGAADRVAALWCNGQPCAAPGPFGLPTMLLDQALDPSAAAPASCIHP